VLDVGLELEAELEWDVGLMLECEWCCAEV
jgi:hypothetical protein